MTKQIFSALKVVALAISLSFGMSYVYAWTAPTVTPPGGNVSAPINTSGVAQVMTGGLTFDSATSTKDIVVNGVTVGMGGGSISTNTANGRSALSTNTTGNYNTANGFQALLVNTTGNDNTANGTNALQSNTTGNYNTANGFQALQSNTTGSGNTANGLSALRVNTTGYYNTANGYRALENDTTGPYNTANGVQSLSQNTTGSYNVATGYASMMSNNVGIMNVATGPLALIYNTSGNYNVALGKYALLYNSTGSGNTAVGTNALQSNTTGSSITAIGSGSDASVGATSNATAIGANAQVNANNEIQLGSTAVTSVRTSGTIHTPGIAFSDGTTQTTAAGVATYPPTVSILTAAGGTEYILVTKGFGATSLTSGSASYGGTPLTCYWSGGPPANAMYCGPWSNWNTTITVVQDGKTYNW